MEGVLQEVREGDAEDDGKDEGKEGARHLADARYKAAVGSDRRADDKDEDKYRQAY